MIFKIHSKLQQRFWALLIALFVSSSLWGNSIPLFATSSVFYSMIQNAHPNTDKLAIQITPEIADLETGGQINLTLPNTQKSYLFTVDKTLKHDNNDVTLSGHFIASGQSYRLLITIGASGAFGRIETPEGRYMIESEDTSAWLLTPEILKNHKKVPFDNDYVIPEKDNHNNNNAHLQANLQTEVAEETSGTANVDVMVLYTQELAKRLGSSLSTRINQLVMLTNQSYLDSQIDMQIHLVHTQEFAYSNSDNNALFDLTDATGVFSSVPSLRESKGADLVILLRDFVSEHSYCGVAWVLGDQSAGTIFNSQRSLGYSVVHDGRYQDGSFNYICSEYTFAHELGHNFGSLHDRDHSSGQGLFSYSYGHDKANTFATIMSYDSPEVGKFSNPNVTCNGSPCGIAEADSQSADNARSINNVRHAIAGFYNSPDTVFHLDIDGDGKVKALTDGLLILRNLFDFSSEALITDARDNNCTRCTTTDIETWISQGEKTLDIDGDGETKPLTDGLLILRCLFGFTGEDLIKDIVAGGCTRCSSELIKNYIESLIPLPK